MLLLSVQCSSVPSPKRTAVQTASLCPGGLVCFQQCNVKADQTDPKVWKPSRFYSASSNRDLQAIQCESSINPPWATTCRRSADTEAHRHLFNNELSVWRLRFSCMLTLAVGVHPEDVAFGNDRNSRTDDFALLRPGWPGQCKPLVINEFIFYKADHGWL